MPQPGTLRTSDLRAPVPVSIPFVRHTAIALIFLFVSAHLYAQSSSRTEKEQRTVQYAKDLLVSSLDLSLPKVNLEYFLAYESAGAEIHWEVNDCGEQTGNPGADRDRDLPMCIEADFDFNHQAVSVLIAVGTSKNALSGKPALFHATITDLAGNTKSIRQLGNLPMELHRPLPRLPRDLPEPRG